MSVPLEHYVEMRDKLCEECERLESENKKLRAALEIIRFGRVPYPAMPDIARDALNTEQTAELK